jgi:hypothetical protein
MSILTFHCEPARSRYTRYRLDPVFDRMPDGAVIGIIRYDIYLDGRFVGSRRGQVSNDNGLGVKRHPSQGCERTILDVWGLLATRLMHGDYDNNLVPGRRRGLVAFFSFDADASDSRALLHSRGTRMRHSLGGRARSISGN